MLYLHPRRRKQRADIQCVDNRAQRREWRQNFSDQKKGFPHSLPKQPNIILEKIKREHCKHVIMENNIDAHGIMPIEEFGQDIEEQVSR